jgi:hypothetical protein
LRGFTTKTLRTRRPNLEAPFSTSAPLRENGFPNPGTWQIVSILFIVLILSYSGDGVAVAARLRLLAVLASLRETQRGR